MTKPSEPGPPLIARGYTSCRYGQMHYLEGRPPADRSATAPTLLLLHQNPSSSLEYEYLIRELARDRRVIAFDTPGYGMSDPPPRPLSIGGYVAAFADALDALQLADSGPLDAFGFHTGSLLAAELGVERPAAIGRLVLAGIPMRSAAERAQRLAEVRATPGPTDDGAELLAKSAALWNRIVTERDPRVPLERAIQMYVERNRPLHRGWWAYEGVWSYDYSNFRRLTQPTLVLAPHDGLVETSRAAAALIAGARFLELPELQRDIFEVGVTRIAAELRAFLTPR